MSPALAALPIWLTLCRRLTASGCSLGLRSLPLLYGYCDCGVRWKVGCLGALWDQCGCIKNTKNTTVTTTSRCTHLF
jgi:hypothetical protein